jgi:hypothetical protein
VTRFGALCKLCQKLLEIINSFGKVAGYKINIWKSVAFLYTNNKQTEKKNQGNSPVYNNSKAIKYLVINLTTETKDLFNENYKPLKRELEEGIRRWRDLSCLLSVRSLRTPTQH